ncbi:c6 finger domain [Pyrenophora seminiperda CCB06]|uniref:C6 finger domain n=1 Tax=Pyrenophora seminiperda CCB06 TaxID=1302712 RepID=A0A3M7MKF3_9PLEO|nr:c6 finger domain [Pyrenophora seminiperda CCB06]
MENQHIDFDGAIYGVEGAFDPSFDPNRQTYNFSQTWPLPISPGTMQQQQHQQHDGSQQHQQNQQSQHSHQRRINNVAASSAHNAHPSTTSMTPLNTMGLGFPTAMQPMNPMLATWMNMNTNTDGLGQDMYGQGSMTMSPDFTASYGGPLRTPIEFGINSHVVMNSMPIAPMNFMPSGSMDGLPTLSAAPFGFDFTNMPSQPDYTAGSNAGTSNSVGTGSPGENWLEDSSLPSDSGWVGIDFNFNHRHRHSYDLSEGSGIFVNPADTLHLTHSPPMRLRSGSSDSNHSPSAGSFSSYEEIFLSSPQSDNDNTLELVQSHSSHHSHSYSSDSCNHGHGLPFSDHGFGNHISPPQSVSPPMARVEPNTIKQPSSNTASPTSSGVSSPPARRRKSPATASGSKPAKTIVKKTPAHTTKKDATGEKRVGRRRGPLRPDQRQQAHEIRKLRACLRCKFLKKTCDKGDPCAGCQPSHARLWQVPCTRIDIKDIAYFMKDWKADYERHVSLGFSIGNIKGFSTSERLIYVTHGYGHYLPIMARDVYVRDEKCFGVDWHETLNGLHFEINTAKLSAGMEGISRAMLSDYLDRHIDGGFEQFVDEYFEGTYFVTELLKTAYRFYCREKLPVIRKALKLVLAYNLTLHVTMVEGLGEEDNTPGKVEDQQSKFSGKTIAPVMINFQVKCALADMWRELQKDVLEELSSLYQSVYSGDKLKNWPTIFMLAAILLAVWELIQFDCNYRVPDLGAVNKFCGEMEGTPVGVIVGLFSAISQKLPSFTEWDSRKHHHLLNSNPAVCDAMTEVRAHVTKYGKFIRYLLAIYLTNVTTETYLRSRSDCKFDRQDFDSLSNKFLSKLVIRAN